MSAPQTPPTKEKSTPNTKTPSKDAKASATSEKDLITLILAAVGPDAIGTAMYNKMEAMKPPPEGRTASAWQHYFRDVKRNAVEMVKGYESAKGGGESVSDVLMLFLRCKVEDEEGADGEAGKTKEKATKATKAVKEPKEKPKGRKRKAASGSDEEAKERGDSSSPQKKSKSVKSENDTDA